MMSNATKKILYVVFAAVLLGLIVAANILRLHSDVRGVKATIEYGDNPHLVTAHTIEHQVLASMPTLRSTPVKDVDCQLVAKKVMANPFVESCSASVSIGGQVTIRVKPSVPIVRLFVRNEEFYMDRKGRYVPISNEGTADVIVANGEFRDPLPTNHRKIDSTFLTKSAGEELSLVWRLADHLYRNPDCGLLFDQIYLDENRDLLLVPKLGDHTVLVGDPENLDKKMFNLIAFYKEGCEKVGWDTYSQINLKYDGQVICTRRNKQ